MRGTPCGFWTSISIMCDEEGVPTVTKEETVQNPKLLNPVTLAYIGDVVYELLVRTMVVTENGAMSAFMLHKTSVHFVCAEAQAKGVDAILPMLTEEEENVYKRGRNSTSSKVPKHADAAQYRKATGLEALFGFLYLTKQEARIRELFSVATNVVKGDLTHEKNEDQ